MPNDLTGDYDVVAQFSLDAVNRILAGMHRGKRLPHALSMAVDDYPDPRTGVGFISIVDRLGNAVLDPAKVRMAASASFSSGSARSAPRRPIGWGREARSRHDGGVPAARRGAYLGP